MNTRLLKPLLAAALVATAFSWQACTSDPEEAKGGIYGTVTDYETGYAVANANVKLRPGGQTTLTGIDGQFEFDELAAGNYSLQLSKAGYEDLDDDYVIRVEAGRMAQRSVQMKRVLSSLRVTNSNGEDISTLDFGAEADVTSRTFSIFNNSSAKLTWWVEVNCGWITEVKSMLSGNQSGQLDPGRQEPVKVTIDRSRLADGVKSYLLNINSDNGSKELLITAGEDIGLPVVATDPVSNLSQTAATFNATVVSDGSPAYTERGFVWGTEAQPTLEACSGKITAALNGQAAFSASVSGLASNQAYYVRAYATNSVGVAYGNDVVFTTGSVPTALTTSAATGIGASTATLNGAISVEGSPAYTERGFVYGQAANPTLADSKTIVSGSGTGPFSATVGNLSYPALYHVRAYATQNGQPVYGNDVSFTTTLDNTSVQTSGVTAIGVSSATFNGTIASVGTPAYTERGFVYSRSPNPNSSTVKVVVGGSGTGNFSHNITGLGLSTTYFVRAYAVQDGRTIYGNEVTFTTLWTDAQVQTTAATNITSSSARFNGMVGDAGAPAYTERGFVYSAYNSAPTINDTRTVATGVGVTGSFYKNMTDLAEGTTYYVRAYALQNGVPVYGATVQFSTDALPVVHTSQVTNLTQLYSVSWNATFNGSVSAAGSPAYVERGFCYGTTSNPTGNRQPAAGSGTGTFSVTVTGLQNYKTYYVRAYAKTASGTYVYGENVSFSTYD